MRLAIVAGYHLLGRPVHPVGQPHGPAQPAGEQFLIGPAVKVELQAPGPVPLLQLVANQPGQVRRRQPAGDLVADARLGKAGTGLGQLPKESPQLLRHFTQRGGHAM
jgi:hypothetical protein